jgi:Domain of unknown function (DUF4180)
MSGQVVEIAGVRAYVCAAEGPLIASERDAADLVGETFSAGVRLVAIPLSRLPPDFLDLRTRLAGAMLQKFVNYERQVAIVGDVSAATARSAALTDFVRESNRGRSVWFVADLEALAERLGAKS